MAWQEQPSAETGGPVEQWEQPPLVGELSLQVQAGDAQGRRGGRRFRLATADGLNGAQRPFEPVQLEPSLQPEQMPLPGLAIGRFEQTGAVQRLELTEAEAGCGIGVAGGLMRGPGLGEAVVVQPERGCSVVPFGLALGQEGAADEQDEGSGDQRAPQPG